MTFDYLGDNCGLDVEYEILEANDEDRLGGRLYTYYFEDKTEKEGKEMPKVRPHDYDDVGAMRYPEVGAMNRTFALFEELDMEFNGQDSKKHREKNLPISGQLVLTISCRLHRVVPQEWTEGVLGRIGNGGLSKTDLPMRCCVDSSYNTHDDPYKSGVLLVSSTRSLEVERIGALISRESPNQEDELKLVVLHNLARLHTSIVAEYEEPFQLFADEYLDHCAYNWYADPSSTGPFAFYGPGQFRKMHPSIVQSSGKHIIIGEAALSHHAWVLGSLESAVRGVYQFLYQHSDVSEAAHNAAQAYNNSKIGLPFGPLPAKLDRPQDPGTPGGGGGGSDDTTVPSTPSPRGELTRHQVLIEEIRPKQGGDVVDPS
ncbi:hypothetical protein PG984_001268 [Apiospora sp. TS-2023a]